MKIKVSYFYQIRFFPKNFIPVSTAHGDPKWFHDGMDKFYIFEDKRGILNGIRCDVFRPGPQCNNLCGGACSDAERDPDHCTFLQRYREQLEQIDFDLFKLQCENLIQRIKDNGYDFGNGEPTVVLMVHEAFNNTCSEWKAIIEWSDAHNYGITKWTKDNLKEVN